MARRGYHWWREYNCDILLDSTLAWERDRETVALGYPTEMAEYAASNPQPTLKALLIANAGMTQQPA